MPEPSIDAEVVPAEPPLVDAHLEDMEPEDTVEPDRKEKRGHGEHGDFQDHRKIYLRSSSSLSQTEEKKSVFFNFMASHPLPFLFALPIVFAIIIALGWTKDDKIETSIERLWISDGGSYARDQDYAAKLGVSTTPATSFLAVAIPRDEGNILTARRLEEVRARMEETETATVEHDGVTYTWDDICFQNPDPYEFPCLRLSPFDLFYEARWYFSEPERVTYYKTVKDAAVFPLLPRFGVVQSKCNHTEACDYVIKYRNDPASLGLEGVEADPLGLFSDVGTLEYSDPCRICIEDKYAEEIYGLYQSIMDIFPYLKDQVEKASKALDDTPENSNVQARMEDIAAKLEQLKKTTTKSDVNEFYTYYTARSMYGDLGVDAYLEEYAASADLIEQCQSLGSLIGLTCAMHPDDVDANTARQHLLNHADNVFSSVNTFGAPTPLWSEPDGTGALLMANSKTGTLFPISGSGVNMSAPMNSLRSYLGSLYLKRGSVDIDSQAWQDLVEANPLYAWFMASLTPAKEGQVCGNEDLPGTDTGIAQLDEMSSGLLANSSLRGCTIYNVPNLEDLGGGVYSKQHFARMWYDIFFDSVLGTIQGEIDPYSWTAGSGCGYVLGGQRYSFTNQSEHDILSNASRLVYNIDEGAEFGAVDRHILIGGATPAIGEYNYDNPLKEVRAFQTLYAGLLAEGIVERVRNCKRPGGPVNNITVQDAEAILGKWKLAMENTWNRGWDSTDGEIEFTSFFDDAGGALGSAGRILEEITLSNGRLMTISIVAIAAFSILFLFSCDGIESRVLVTMVGVSLVVMSYFTGIGVGLLLDIKINVSISWTLPFVIIGLGVDDVYIVLLAIRKQGGFSKRHWIKAMQEVAVPVTMTSLVNASMFAILNLSDIPIIYLTSRVACFCVIALYLSVLFCFPAFCYLDLKRQEAGRMDVAFCRKSSGPPAEARTEDFRNRILYNMFYKPIIFGTRDKVRYLIHVTIIMVSLVVLGVGAWGITERETGLSIGDFVPEDEPANRWLVVTTENIDGGPSQINWGALRYTDPDTQMYMLKQFENLVAIPNVVDADTKQVWMADFAIWTSRLCTDNFGRDDFDTLKCGRDQLYEGDNSTCAGAWVSNKFDLREKSFQDVSDGTCKVLEGGVCRPRKMMHADDLLELNREHADAQSFCPVINGWSDDKWQFCLAQWRNLTGGSGSLLLEQEEEQRQGLWNATTCGEGSGKDEKLKWPIPYSSGPLIFAYNYSDNQEETLAFLANSRAVCDNDNRLHCWMSGNAYDYWSQYVGIFGVLVELAEYATLAGFAISFISLFGKLAYEKHHPLHRILVGSLVGSLLIGIIIVLSLVTVIGCSVLAGVTLTGFSNLSFVLSVGFSVEYSVHIVSRWMGADMSHKASLDRVDYTMSFLMLPTFMSFVSSTIGVICLAFTEFEFNKIFFFRPLMITMVMSYWYGCWFLPTLLIYLDFDSVKLGKPASLLHAKASLMSSGDSTRQDNGNVVDARNRRLPTLNETPTTLISPPAAPTPVDKRLTRSRPDPPSGPSALVEVS